MKTSYNNRMKNRTAVLLLGTLSVLVLSLMPTGNAVAQDVGDYIQQTGDILSEVRDLVIESDSERARRVFDEAHRRHEQSLGLIGDHPIMALAISKRAREGALQARRLARTANSFQQRAHRYISRLRDLHENIKDRAVDSGNKRAMKFIREAEQLFHRAQNQFQQQHYEVAFNLLKSAEKQLKRAARILYEDGGDEKLEKEIEKTTLLIEKAEENMPDNPDQALVELLKKSRSTLKDAEQALSQDKPMIAMRQLKKSRNIVKKLLRQIGGQPTSTNIEKLFERFDQKFSELTVDGSELIDKAKAIRNEAEVEQKNGNTKIALRKIRIALNLLTQAGES
jgi:tetratricopeptide (TPR) repeat protein